MKRILVFILLLAALCVPAFAQSRGGARAGRAAALDEPGTTQVILRCAYWQRPADKDAQKLFIKSGHEYRILPVLEMAFQYSIDYRGPVPIPVYRKATEAEIAARQAAGVKKTDLEYVPLFSINPRGMKDIGVVLLPGNLENKAEKDVLVFDWSEKAFPYGSVRIANFCKRRLMGMLKPQGDPEGETFALAPGKFFTSRPMTESDRIYELQLAALVNKEPKMIYSSAARFYGNARVIIFIVPKAGAKQTKEDVPVLDFRSIIDRKHPERENQPASAAQQRRNERNGEPAAERPNRQMNPQNQPQNRRP